MGKCKVPPDTVDLTKQSPGKSSKIGQGLFMGYATPAVPYFFFSRGNKKRKNAHHHRGAVPKPRLPALPGPWARSAAFGATAFRRPGLRHRLAGLRSEAQRRLGLPPAAWRGESARRGNPLPGQGVGTGGRGGIYFYPVAFGFRHRLKMNFPGGV